MVKKSRSVLVVGFNTRPLVFSLHRAGYEVYAVDFFGDLDLTPYVSESLILTKRLGSNYNLMKDNYKQFLAEFSLEMLQKHPTLNYLLIGSGLDDALSERKLIIEEIKRLRIEIMSVNNEIAIIKEARNIENLYSLLRIEGFKVPKTISFENYERYKCEFEFPFILKKKASSGGINVVKIEAPEQYSFHLQRFKTQDDNSSNWMVQEFIEGIAVSCTTISNGEECRVVSINRQIIGLKFLNPPKEFMYCGNIVPANLLKADDEIISKISLFLTKKLGLKGINGFDYILKNHSPYLMEINPRIPGSIRASEIALDLNLLDLHIRCFDPEEWAYIKNQINFAKPDNFATKLIFFAPYVINEEMIMEINKLKFIYDKSEPNRPILPGEPICSILFKGKSFSDSYFGALKIADKIKEIITKTFIG